MRKRIIRLKNKIADKITNLDQALINFLENFDKLIHLFLAILIVFISLAIFTWFIHDAYGLFKNIIEFKKNISASALRLFGTAILLWPLSSLLKAEINLIKGEKISLNLFVDTAIAGTIRSILISTSEGEEIKETYYYVISLLIFAIVRLTVVYTEKIERNNDYKKAER